MAEEVGLSHGPLAAQMFGNAGKEHMEKYGTESIGKQVPRAWLALLLIALSVSAPKGSDG